MMPWLLAAFAGGVKTLVQLQGAGLADIDVSPDNASVGYRLNSDGNEQSYQGDGASYTTIALWLLLGSAGDYECRLVVNSGDAPAGSATNTWLSLSTTRAWTLTQLSIGTASNNCTIEIRNASTLDVLATDTVTMSIEVES